MRALFWLLAVFAVAVALVILGRVGAGYVMFVYPPYRVELSLLFFVVASFAGFLLLYAAMRLLGHAVSLPTYVRAYRSRRRRERAHAALAAAPPPPSRPLRSGPRSKPAAPRPARHARARGGDESDTPEHKSEAKPRGRAGASRRRAAGSRRGSPRRRTAATARRGKAGTRT